MRVDPQPLGCFVRRGTVRPSGIPFLLPRRVCVPAPLLHPAGEDWPLSLRANGVVPGSLAPASRNRGFASLSFASRIAPSHVWSVRQPTD
jgi:hypothetical protein